MLRRKTLETGDPLTLGLEPSPEHRCPYLAERLARERAFMTDKLPPGIYHRLMDWDWRRSGRILYRPACATCSECRPIRIPVDRFEPSANQRKILNRNADLTLDIAEAQPTAEKFELFVRYQAARHSGDMCTQWGEFSAFLYETPVNTQELLFRDGDRLLGSAIVDLDGYSISSVYTYYDPEETRRSLGTWAILWLIEFARRRQIPFYYLGYYIAACRKMNYKTRFRPCEIGDGAGSWTRLEKGGHKDAPQEV